MKTIAITLFAVVLIIVAIVAVPKVIRELSERDFPGFGDDVEIEITEIKVAPPEEPTPEEPAPAQAEEPTLDQPADPEPPAEPEDETPVADASATVSAPTASPNVSLMAANLNEGRITSGNGRAIAGRLVLATSERAYLIRGAKIVNKTHPDEEQASWHKKADGTWEDEIVVVPANSQGSAVTAACVSKQVGARKEFVRLRGECAGAEAMCVDIFPASAFADNKARTCN